jgi:hypothetical protein
VGKLRFFWLVRVKDGVLACRMRFLWAIGTSSAPPRRVYVRDRHAEAN